MDSLRQVLSLRRWGIAAVTSRSAVVLSGLVFAAVALLGYQVLGWKLDGWVMALAGAAHLAVVLKRYPRLDAFLIGFHYVVALVGLAGVAWVLVEVAGAAAGARGVASSLLQDQWTEPLQYAIFSGYALLLTALFVVLVVVFSWLIHRRSPKRHELLAGLFVASLLNIPCDFALADALSQVAVLDPEKPQAFVFAVGLESLDFPVLLHCLMALVVAVSWKVWKPRHSLSRTEPHPSGSS